MRTSSIVAAVILAITSLNQAAAGGWIASARPNIAPLTRMVGVPLNRAPASFGPVNRVGSFNHFSFANRFAPQSGRFGEFGFQRPFGGYGFQGPFGRFGFQRPSGPAGVLFLGSVAPSLPPPSLGGEPLDPPIIWAPSYVTMVSGEPRCDDDARPAGGPKIIMIGAPPRPTGKLPVVIYGSHGGCA